MDRNIARRDFLRTAPAAAGVLALAAQGSIEAAAPTQPSTYPEIGSEKYTPADYPIRAKRFSEVSITRVASVGARSGPRPPTAWGP